MEYHRDIDVVKKWPFRIDLKLSTNELRSLYFDTRVKLDRWMAALDWILEQGETTQSEHSRKDTIMSLSRNKVQLLAPSVA